MRAVIIDDAGAIRDYVASTLSEISGVMVLGMAGGEDEAVALIERERPDLMLLDLQLAPGSGLNVLKRVRAAGIGTRGLVFSNHASEDAYREACLAAGAEGVFDKSAGIGDLRQAILAMLPPPAEASRPRADRPATGQRAQADSFASATRDPLTGLLNRAALSDRLRHAIRLVARAGRKLAVLSVGLEHFRRIEEPAGRPADDMMLRLAATRIGLCVRASDTVARLDADEFAVVLEGLEDEADATQVADKIIGMLGDPNHVDGEGFTVRASIGVAIYPEHGSDDEAMVRHAGRAMSWIRQNGRGGRATFSPEIEGAARDSEAAKLQ